MRTQVEHIKKSEIAYIVKIKEGKGSIDRFSIYLQNKGELEILWVSDSHKGRAFEDRLPYQVYSLNKNFPAFHFVLHGSQYSKEHELKEMLKNINKNIEVFTLHAGWSPTPI